MDVQEQRGLATKASDSAVVGYLLVAAAAAAAFCLAGVGMP